MLVLRPGKSCLRMALPMSRSTPRGQSEPGVGADHHEGGENAGSRLELRAEGTQLNGLSEAGAYGDDARLRLTIR